MTDFLFYWVTEPFSSSRNHFSLRCGFICSPDLPTPVPFSHHLFPSVPYVILWVIYPYIIHPFNPTKSLHLPRLLLLQFPSHLATHPVVLTSPKYFSNLFSCVWPWPSSWFLCLQCFPVLPPGGQQHNLFYLLCIKPWCLGDRGGRLRQ